MGELQVHALFADDLARTAEIRDRALAMADPGEGFALLFDRLTADLHDPQAPGLIAAALIQASATRSSPGSWETTRPGLWRP
ncbi:hypothetical protein [Streptomyces sp. B22F1]|uniref:hypothetical protein n=1 Tax=Streptomyces sp. B22F1 TaxID=3153566 RepID=UPI00325F043F